MNEQTQIDISLANEEEVLPPIPAGEVLRTEFIEPMGVEAADLAHMIAVDPAIIEKIINREVGISGDLAQKLIDRFGVGWAFWHNMQSKYDTGQIAFKDLKDELLQDYETGATKADPETTS